MSENNALSKAFEWPMGVQPEMDRHAAAQKLGHWSCVDPGGNGIWQRIDGLQVSYAGRGVGTYMDELRSFDAANPMSIAASGPTVAAFSRLELEVRNLAERLHYEAGQLKRDIERVGDLTCEGD